MMKRILTILIILSQVAYAQLPLCPKPPDGLSQQVNMGVQEPVPVFNSYPIGADGIIYFDFDGDIITDPFWVGYGAIRVEPSGMTTAQMFAALTHSAEDYIPFKIAVTTDSLAWEAAPQDKRSRISVTPTSAWYPGAGGVALLGSFRGGYRTSGFVFTDRLLYNSKYVGEACSHESGHTFSLKHQVRWDDNCVLTESYHSGFGENLPSENGWAPIMGVSYYKKQTTWSNLTTSDGCTSVADEVAEILANGITFRPKSLIVILPKLIDTAIINILTATLMTSTAFSGGNTDMQLEIGGTVSNNPDSLTTRLVKTLQPGVHYLTISGKDNIYSPDYGNTGGLSLIIQLEPLVVIPIRPDSLYRRLRIVKMDYVVFDLAGKRVKRGFGELGKAADNIPNGHYFIKTKGFTYQISKQ